VAIVTVGDEGLLVLTAAIDPRGCPDVHRSDPALRERDYVDALGRWIALMNRVSFRILFIENSGTDLRSFRSRIPHIGDLDIIQYTEASDVIAKGKGNAEGRIIERIAEYLEESAHSGVVAKCTGRLWVNNFDACVKDLRRSEPFFRLTIRRSLNVADSRFFICDCTTWRKYLRGMDKEVEEPSGVFLEHVLARRALRAIGDGVPFRPFPRLPRIQGVSATTGHNYTRGLPYLRRELHDRLRSTVGKRTSL
jgi:hypothetical protein